jgi:hypothetical protein
MDAVSTSALFQMTSVKVRMCYVAAVHITT